jgi:hypothetical protein
MNNFLRFLQVLALGGWLGAIFYFSAVVAPTAFAELRSKDLAGVMVGHSLGHLHAMGLIAAVIYLIAGALGGSIRAFAKPAMIGVIVMVALTVLSQNKVTVRMATLRTEMVSIENTPADDPRRVEFDKLHSASVALEGAVFLIGLVALYLTVARPVVE